MCSIFARDTPVRRQISKNVKKLTKICVKGLRIQLTHTSSSMMFQLIRRKLLSALAHSRLVIRGIHAVLLAAAAPSGGGEAGSEAQAAVVAVLQGLGSPFRCPPPPPSTQHKIVPYHGGVNLTIALFRSV